MKSTWSPLENVTYASNQSVFCWRKQLPVTSRKDLRNFRLTWSIHKNTEPVVGHWFPPSERRLGIQEKTDTILQASRTKECRAMTLIEMWGLLLQKMWFIESLSSKNHWTLALPYTFFAGTCTWCGSCLHLLCMNFMKSCENGSIQE